jgi:hypothetical protein
MNALRALGAVLLVASLSACASDPAPASGGAGGAGAGVDGCALLFGKPNAKTGVSADRCKPTCSCGGKDFTPPEYSADFVRSLVDGYALATPYPPIATDPYAGPKPVADPAETVCAVKLGPPGATPRSYALATYASLEEAVADGAKPTHYGHCGVCSTLANLAVYIREEDLTAPVRECGLEGGDMAANVACLQKLGFDEPCADAWYWDTVHTKSKCLDVCLAAIASSYQSADGALNPCIQCDEDESGPVFKAIAGRTRRNSGLPNALCRPCSEVRPLVHAY